MLFLQFIISLYVLNAGYCFTNVGKPLETYHFSSQSLLTIEKALQRCNIPGARILQTLPLPLPSDYVYGIDRQKADFEAGSRSYLRGEWRERGWWYYYIYGLLVKTPLGTLALFALAFVCGRSATATDWAGLLMPFWAILCLLTTQNGFSTHVRYAIPLLPFAFIWCSRVFATGGARAASAWIILCYSAVSSMCVYPHSLSYFNEIAGGARNGHFHLIDSNIAWGQDLLHLKKWLDRNPEVSDIKLASFGWVDPEFAGIQFSLPPETFSHDIPPPGWYVVDVNFLRGSHWPAAAGSGKWRAVSSDGANLEYFRGVTPTAMIGYSMYIYHVGDGGSTVKNERKL